MNKATADPAAVMPHVNNVPRRAWVTGLASWIILKDAKVEDSQNRPRITPRQVRSVLTGEADTVQAEYTILILTYGRATEFQSDY